MNDGWAYDKKVKHTYARAHTHTQTHTRTHLHAHTHIYTHRMATFSPPTLGIGDPWRASSLLVSAQCFQTASPPEPKAAR